MVLTFVLQHPLHSSLLFIHISLRQTKLFCFWPPLQGTVASVAPRSGTRRKLHDLPSKPLRCSSALIAPYHLCPLHLAASGNGLVLIRPIEANKSGKVAGEGRRPHGHTDRSIHSQTKYVAVRRLWMLDGVPVSGSLMANSAWPAPFLLWLPLLWRLASLFLAAAAAAWYSRRATGF